MRSFFLALVFVLSFLCFEQSAGAQEVTLLAGTLLNCTLDEPNVSSVSAQAGDPVICHARGVQQFGHAVFPRGAYLAGHLTDSKDPGHFWGKGWLKLEFDRLSLPGSMLPVPGKIVSVRGYRVDREGKIGAFDLNEVDWDRTVQLNAERGITVTLRARPRVH